MSQNPRTGHVPGTPIAPSDSSSVASRRSHTGLNTSDDPAREVGEDRESTHDASSSEASFQSDADFNRLFDQIKEFAVTKVWPGSDAQAIEVQRIPAIYWTLASLSKGDDYYVLRIPNERWGDGDLIIRHTVTQANFARYRAGFPVPELSMVDSTKNNMLESSFILEKKASGTVLSEVWDTMTHSDKCQLARELGMHARKMLSKSCAVAGTIAIPDGLGPLEFCVKPAVVSRPDPEFIPPVPEPPSEFFSELKDEGSLESVCELMQRLLRVHLAMAECDYREHWKVQRPCSDMGEMEDVIPEGIAEERQADEIESNETEDEDEDLSVSQMLDALDDLDYDDGDESNPMRNMLILNRAVFSSLYTVAEKLEEKGFFENDCYTFSGIDFDLHSIMVDIDRPAGEPIIKAFFGTEDLSFTPKFSACKPPLWLWASVGANFTEFLDVTNIEWKPEIPSLREIRDIFDEAAGPEFVKLAYGTEYWIARALYDYCLHGLQNGECQCSSRVDDACALLREAAEMFGLTDLPEPIYW